MSAMVKYTTTEHAMPTSAKKSSADVLLCPIQELVGHGNRVGGPGQHTLRPLAKG